MDEDMLPMMFPVKGLDLQGPVSQQPESTTPIGNNVRAFEATTQRMRGGSRPGLTEYIAHTVDGTALIQELNSIVYMSITAMINPPLLKANNLHFQSRNDSTNYKIVNFSATVNGSTVSTNALASPPYLVGWVDNNNSALRTAIDTAFSTYPDANLFFTGSVFRAGSNSLVLTYNGPTDPTATEGIFAYDPWTSTDGGVTWVDGTRQHQNIFKNSGLVNGDTYVFNFTV